MRSTRRARANAKIPASRLWRLLTPIPLMQLKSAPLVSILIPAYNAERWIAQSVLSALGQTWANKEIIVVDDGSTDQTASIASIHESQGVRVHRQANQGAAAARNAAFALSRGDYIQWLDADDLLDPDKIERQLAALSPEGEPRILLSGAWGTFYSRPERAKFVPSPLWEDLAPVEWLRRKMASGSDFMAIESWLVSRELTEAAGPWDSRLIVDDDGEYFCRVLLACSAVRFIPDSRVRVRRSGSQGVSHIGRSAAKIEAQLLSCELHVDYLRSLDDSKQTRDACRQYLEKYIRYIRPTQPGHLSRAHALLASVGGELNLPRPKLPYSVMQTLFGRALADGIKSRVSQAKRTFRALREAIGI